MILRWKKKFEYFELINGKAIQAKFEALSEPIYTKNNEIIQGTRNPTSEEIQNLESYLTEDEVSKKDSLLVELKAAPL